MRRDRVREEVLSVYRGKSVIVLSAYDPQSDSLSLLLIALTLLTISMTSASAASIRHTTRAMSIYLCLNTAHHSTSQQE